MLPRAACVVAQAAFSFVVLAVAFHLKARHSPLDPNRKSCESEAVDNCYCVMMSRSLHSTENFTINHPHT